jgi:nucleotide sugar dehydrogenase
MAKKKIGFIGQGWIGKNYADNFESRGYQVVRYSLEAPYRANRDLIALCDIVFIAVPTPTTPDGFDDHIVREAVTLVGPGKIAVIKSTILPGTAESVQAENPGIIVLHSPEFLSEASARYDADNPFENIIGIPVDTERFKEAARAVLAVLPEAPYNLICRAREAELIKYIRNCFLYTKVVFMNLSYDLATDLEADWRTIKEAMAADPMVGRMHLEPLHKTGRGAGGHCFIKDFEAFTRMYGERRADDQLGLAALAALRDKNLELLVSSGKDLDLLSGVYGPVTSHSSRSDFLPSSVKK